MKKLFRRLLKVLKTKGKNKLKTPKDEKKITITLSGSFGLDEDTKLDLTEDLEGFNLLNLEDTIEKLLGMGWIEDQLKQSVAPVYMIKAETDRVWLYNVAKRSFQSFENMTEITAIGEKISDTKSYCYINNDIYEVDIDMIHCLGWN